MRLTAVGLLFTLTVFFNSLEFSSQSGSPSFQGNYPQIPVGRMKLPPPFYYDDINANGEIRAHGHPNARPLIRENIFSGMTDGYHFFPIVIRGKIYTLNLETRNATELNENQRRILREEVELHIRGTQDRLGYSSSNREH